MITRRNLFGGDSVEIASAIVHVLPGRAEALGRRLAALPGVDIHARSDDGRFVVTVEDTAGATAGDTLLGLHRIEDVLSVALVSHYEA